MREFKFRYYDFKNEQMATQNWADRIDSVLSKWEKSIHVSDPMQYIGVKDKNGKEIYENDIVHVKHFYKNREHIGKVVYCMNRFEVENFYFPHYDDPSNAFEAGMGEIEVLGNTFENAELLEGWV